MATLRILPHPSENGTSVEKSTPQAATHEVREDSSTTKTNLSEPNGALKKDLYMTFVVLMAQVFFFCFVRVWKKHTRDTGEPYWGIYGFKIFGTSTNCDQLKHQRSALSLTVNIIAAAVTIFSPGTLQLLSAPSRRILDDCHKDGKYMEIGVQSFRNMWSSPNRFKLRFWLWILLFLVSLTFNILYNSVIVLSIPATQSYQVTLSDTFFTTSGAQLGLNPDSPPNETFSTMAAMVTSSSKPHSPTQTTGPSKDGETTYRESIQTADQLNSSVSDFHKDERYATSPFVAFNSNITSSWPGLDQVEKDLVSLMQNMGSWNSSASWREHIVNSTDWYTLDFSECLDTFSIRYRPYAGTVFLVLGMEDMVDIEDIDNPILGLSYLSHNVSSLAIVCPTAYANLSKSDLSQNLKDAPVLPLLYGTFDKPRPTSFKPRSNDNLGMAEGWRTCPQGKQGYNSPLVKGCFLRNRTSYCRLGYNTFFFFTIIIFLFIKMVLLLIAIYFCSGEQPLLTIGDTMAEYLKDEDEYTKDSCLQLQGHDWKIVHAELPAAAPRVRSRRNHCMTKIWRMVYPGSSTESTDTCLSEDILRYSHRDDRGEIPAWLAIYFVTLLVTAGIFTYVGLQDGWVVKPTTKGDLRWVIWPSVLVNCPQLLCSIRNSLDTRVLTSRNSRQEFAGFADGAQALRVDSPKEGSAQRHLYFVGDMNFLVFLTMTGLQALYSFIVSQLLIPQWINPLEPDDLDDVFSPQFLLRFGTTQKRSTTVNIVIIVIICIFPFVGVYIVNAISSLVVRCRTLKVSDLSDFIPQFLQEIICLPSRLRFKDRKLKETAHLLPRIPVQMPGPATNSLAIALACHPLNEDKELQMEEKLLRWGVVRWPDEMGRGGHCSFTAYPYQRTGEELEGQGNALRLEPGKHYTGIRSVGKRRYC